MWKLILVLGLLLFVLYKNWKMLLYKIMIMYYNIKKMYNKILNKNKVVKLLNKIKIDLFIIYEYRLSDVDNRTYDINIIKLKEEDLDLDLDLDFDFDLIKKSKMKILNCSLTTLNGEILDITDLINKFSYYFDKNKEYYQPYIIDIIEYIRLTKKIGDEMEMIIYFNDDIFTEKNIKINEILYKKVNEIFSI